MSWRKQRLWPQNQLQCWWWTQRGCRQRSSPRNNSQQQRIQQSRLLFTRTNQTCNEGPRKYIFRRPDVFLRTWVTWYFPQPFLDVKAEHWRSKTGRALMPLNFPADGVKKSKQLKATKLMEYLSNKARTFTRRTNDQIRKYYSYIALMFCKYEVGQEDFSHQQDGQTQLS